MSDYLSGNLLALDLLAGLERLESHADPPPPEPRSCALSREHSGSTPSDQGGHGMSRQAPARSRANQKVAGVDHPRPQAPISNGAESPLGPTPQRSQGHYQSSYHQTHTSKKDRRHG